MAVKPEQIKARLKAKYPKANLSQKRMDEYSAKLAPRPADDADDAAIDAILEEANGLIDFEAVAKEDDRVRTLEKNQKTPADPPTPPTPPTPPADPPTPPADPNKALLDAINGLKTEIQEIKTGKITETKKATAKGLIAKSEVLKALKPELQEAWANRFDLDSETPLEDQLTGLEAEYTTLTQDFANSIDYSGPTPRGGGDVKPSDATVAEIVSNM